MLRYSKFKWTPGTYRVSPANLWSRHHATAPQVSSFRDAEYQYLPPSSLPTYYFQKSLPRLPVPTLEKTLQRYLECIKCILKPEEFFKTEKLVKQFETTGTSLHKELLEIDKTLKGTSYISGPWFEMYLRDRQPLPINYNPALVFVEDKVIDDLPFNQRQLVRTTNLLVSSLRFMKSLDNHTLGPEVYHMNAKKSDKPLYYQTMKFMPTAYATYGSYLFKAFPLDMSQYKNLFRSTRIPQVEMDKIQSSDENVKHIIVMRRGHIYSVPVLDSSGDIFPINEIMGNLEVILEDKSLPEKYPLGILTSQERNKWAEIRDHLISTHPINKQSISEIDSALFVLCLDDEVLEDDLVKVTHNFLHSDGTNRWFDKSFQIISTKDAWAGVTFEHAWGDGVAVLRFFNEIYLDVKMHQWSNSVQAKRPIKAPHKLIFEYDDKTKAGIEDAKSRLLSQTESLEIHPFLFEKYGKQECKRWAISPDSVMQLGFQIAYHRMFNHTPASYESCSTAAFKHGRTETIRPATYLTQQVSQILSGGDWQSRTSELKDLIKKCSQKHNELTKEAAMGQGFDRHLFALRTIAQKKGLETPDLFKDDAYRRINVNIISTSTLASPAVRIGAFGPVSQDGFGLGYQIWEGGLGCVTATYKGQKDGKAFVDTCHKVFTDIQTILSS